MKTIEMANLTSVDLTPASSCILRVMKYLLENRALFNEKKVLSISACRNIIFDLRRVLCYIYDLNDADFLGYSSFEDVFDLFENCIQ